MACKLVEQTTSSIVVPEHLPTLAHVRDLYHQLLLYWCSPETAKQLLAVPLAEAVQIPYLDDITRIMVASSPTGKKTRRIHSFIQEARLTRPGNIPFELDAYDPEAISTERPREGAYVELHDTTNDLVFFKRIEPSTNASAAVVNWKLQEAVKHLLGKQGGASLIVANDLTVYIGSEAQGYVRLPNPERIKDAEEARGGKFTWKVITDALDNIAALIAHDAGQPAKSAHILYHFVTGFSRQAQRAAKDTTVIHNIGWAFKVGIHGIEKAALQRDMEQARQQNQVGIALKRPPLVPFAEKYTSYMTSLDIVPLLLRPDLTDDVGQPHTHPESGNIIDPGFADRRFVRPEIFSEGDVVFLQDVLGVKHVFEDWQQARELFMQQQEVFKQIIGEVMEFMITGVPPHSVLKAILQTLPVPTHSNVQEVTIVGYPELAEQLPGDTPAEFTEKAKRALITYKTPSKRWFKK